MPLSKHKHKRKRMKEYERSKKVNIKFNNASNETKQKK